MDSKNKPCTTVDEYIRACPREVQPILVKIREIVRKAAPSAEETISYRMPAYKLGKYLVFFAAMKNHIGFYPTPSGILAFKKELAPYKTSKGAIQFPLDKPIPYGLIRKITGFRVREIARQKQ